MAVIVHGRRGFSRVATSVVVLLVLVGLVWSVNEARLRVGDPLSRAKGAYGQGSWSQAADEAREALKRRPDDPDALRILARSWVRLGRDDAALAIYSRRLAEGEIEAEDDLLLGMLYERRGKKEEALRTWEKLLEEVDVSGQTLDELARLHLKGHRREEAARVVERLGRQKGWEARSAMMLGTIRAGLNDVPGAAESFHRAISLDPAEVDRSGDPKAHRMLIARTFLRTGNPVEARAMLEPRPGPGDRSGGFLAPQPRVFTGRPERPGAGGPGRGRVIPRRERPGIRALALRGRIALRAVPPGHLPRIARQPAHAELLSRRPDPGDPPPRPSLARPRRSQGDPYDSGA